MPKLPLVDNCCLCFNLETGSKIIGWMCTIGQTILAIIYAISLYIAFQELPDANGKTIEITPEVKALIGFRIVVCVFYVVLGIYLLIGIAKSNMSYVKFYLNCVGIIIIIEIVSVILNIIAFFFGIHFNQILSIIIALIVECYYYIVVYSYYTGKNTTTEATY